MSHSNVGIDKYDTLNGEQLELVKATPQMALATSECFCSSVVSSYTCCAPLAALVNMCMG